MKNYSFSLLLALSCSLFASPLDHLCKIEDRTHSNPIRGIDAIYLINLDQRPEKLAACLSQLAIYDIRPYRVPAIYGWGLSAETLNSVGMTYTPGMQRNRWASSFSEGEPAHRQLELLHKSCYGKTLFATWTSLGAIGCSLSHFSALRNAYDEGYKTIWVMEDDIFVKENPHQLTELMEELDRLTGDEGWDVLFTDNDTMNQPLYDAYNDFESDLNGDMYLLWRPDQPWDDAPFRKRTLLSDNLMQIGSRMRIHSMLIRRSGMEKILKFEKEHGIFAPYDHEIALVPGIRLFSVRRPIVSLHLNDSASDTHHKHF